MARPLFSVNAEDAFGKFRRACGISNGRASSLPPAGVAWFRCLRTPVVTGMAVVNERDFNAGLRGK